MRGALRADVLIGWVSHDAKIVVLPALAAGAGVGFDPAICGPKKSAELPVVLAHLGGAWRIGVQTDSVSGRYVAVFVPNSPNPMSGSIFLVASDRVRPANVPLAAAIASLRRRAEWRDDVSTFVSRDLIEAAVDRGVLVRPTVPKGRYVGFCNPSGGVSDAFTLTIAHTEGEVALLD